MTMTRRSVIAGAATAGAVLTLSELHTAAAQTGRVRYNATSPQGKAMLVKYAEAVSRMKALSKTNPSNWDFQWYSHWIPDTAEWGRAQIIKAQMINTVFSATSPTDPHRQLATAMWDTCQKHSSNPNDPNEFLEPFFLPWHRFFVYYFEEIIRSVLNDNAFTLPYWNYLSTNPDDKIMPPEFRDQQSPLFVQNRNPWVNAGRQIDSDPSADPISNDCFKERVYSRFCQIIDANPHGAVHDDVGTITNMGFVPTAAQDPIFWVHHCEIDRLWESWNRLGHPNPQPWPDRSFVYADANGTKAIRECKDANRVGLFGYEYDSYYVPPFAVTTETPGPRTAAFNVVQETTRAVGSGPLQLSGGGSRIVMRAPPAIALRTESQIAAEAKRPIFQTAPGQELYLVLGDIAVPNPVNTTFDIYLDLPQGQRGGGRTDPHYVGTLGFFGIEPREPNSSHGDHERVFNVTGVTQALESRDMLTPTPSVTAEPNGELRGGIPVIGRVALVAG